MEKIIDALGDGISQLMMLLIVLQERNAEPPPQIRGGVDMVKNSSDTLHQVANNLANTDYADFPTIQTKVLEASSALAVASDDFIASYNNLLSSPQRAAAWNRLVDSLKEMSRRTVHVLEAVYGAERERVILAAQRALDAIDKTHPDSAASNPRDFTEKVSHAATKANELAELMRGKAETVESEQQRQALLSQADEINKASRILIEDANHLLKDRNNAELVSLVIDDLDNLTTEVNRGKVLIEQIDDLGLSRSFEDRSRDLDRQLADLASSGKTDLSDEILYVAKKERGELDNLQEDLNNGDANAAQRSLDEAQLYNQQLGKLARLQADRLQDDPQKQQALRQAADQLDRIFPGYQSAATRAIGDPNNDATRDALDAQHDKLEEAINRLTDLVTNPNAEILAAARKEREDLRSLNESAKMGDQQMVARHAKNVVVENNLLNQHARQAAQQTSDPERRRQIQNACDELQRLLPHELLAAKSALEDPSPQMLAQLDAATHSLSQQVETVSFLARNYPELDLIEACKNEREMIKNLSNAGRSGNQREVNNIAPHFSKNTHLISKLAKEIALKKDRPRQAQILAALTKLDRAVEKSNKDAAAAAGGNRAAADTLARNSVDVNQAVDEILDLTDALLFAEALKQRADLSDLKNGVNAGDPSSVADRMSAIANRQSSMIPMTRAAAQRTEDPLRRKQLMDDADELERLLPTAVSDTNRYMENPDDDLAQLSLLESTTRMEQLYGGIADPNEVDRNATRHTGRVDKMSTIKSMMPAMINAAERLAANPLDPLAQRQMQDALEGLPFDALMTDEERCATLIRDQHDALQRLTEAAERGDRAGVEAAYRDLADNQKALKELAQSVANSLPDWETNRKRDIEDCLQALDMLIPQVYQQGKQVAANPSDQQARKKMHDTAHEIRTNLDVLNRALNGSPESNAARAAQLEKEALERLRKAVKAGDKAGAEKALADVKKYNSELCENSRTMAGAIRDPATNQRVLETINALESLMPLMSNDCTQAAANPRDAALQSRAMADIDRCQQLIDQLLNDTKANTIEIAQREINLLDCMDKHTKAEDAGKAAEDVQQLVETHKALQRAVNQEIANHPNPRTKEALQAAMNEANQLFKPHIEKTKEAMMHPESQAAKDALTNSTADIKAPVQQIIAILRPSPENVTDANVAREKALLGQLRQAAAAGDRVEVEKLLPAIQTLSDRITANARQQAANTADSDTKQKLLQSADQLDQLQRQLPEIARAAAANPRDANAQAKLAAHTKRMESVMDAIALATRPQVLSDAEKGRRIANAMLRQSKSGRIDSMKFLNAAQTLANFINGLGGGESAGGAGSLDDEMKRLQQNIKSAPRSSRPTINTPLDDLLSFLKNLATGSHDPKTFDQVIQAVANDIKRTADYGDSNDPVTIHTRNIALALSQLAQAAKNGKRQEMIQAGRDAAQHINSLCNELSLMASKCSDPRTKDRLLRAIQAMKNYSTQLKILTSVKAGSPSGADADTEDQLISVARSLGASLAESMSCVYTIRGGKLDRDGRPMGRSPSSSSSSSASKSVPRSTPSAGAAPPRRGATTPVGGPSRGGMAAPRGSATAPARGGPARGGAAGRGGVIPARGRDGGY